jgi:hypothetical protein
VGHRLAIAAAFTAAALAAVCLAAGCSSGKNIYAENPQLTQPALSLARFVQRADAICRRDRARLRSLPRPRDSATLIAYVRGLEELSSDDVRSLEALRPPAGRRAEYTAYLGAMRKTRDFVRGPVATALLSGDHAKSARLAAQLGVLQRKAHRLAAVMGLDGCER